MSALDSYHDKAQELFMALKSPVFTEQDISDKVNRLNMYIKYNRLNDEGVFEWDINMILPVYREMNALYANLFDGFKNKTELKAAYKKLSKATKNIFSEYDVVSDWELRQTSKAYYQEMLSYLENSEYFTEEQLLEKFNDYDGKQIVFAERSNYLLSFDEIQNRYSSKFIKAQPGYILPSTANGVPLNLVYCPMGSEVDEWVYSEKKAIWMGQTEVTQELFRAVMGFNPSYFKDSPKNPVEEVTWFDCISFCNKLSELLGLQPCYKMAGVKIEKEYPNSIKSAKVVWNEGANGFRLPSAEEWETCAKAGTNNAWAGTNVEAELVNYAWYNKNSKRKTHPVGELSPNEWGLYDMSGNVWEWLWEKRFNFFDHLTYWRHLGGNCYSSDRELCSDYFNSALPGYTATIGFRICRNF